MRTIKWILIGAVALFVLCAVVVGVWQGLSLAASSDPISPTAPPASSTIPPTEIATTLPAPTATIAPTETAVVVNMYCPPAEVARVLDELQPLTTAGADLATRISQVTELSGYAALWPEADSLYWTVEGMRDYPPCMERLMNLQRSAFMGMASAVELAQQGALEEAANMMLGVPGDLKRAEEELFKITACLPDCQPEDLE